MLVFMRLDSGELDPRSGVLFRGGACPGSSRTHKPGGSPRLYCLLAALWEVVCTVKVHGLWNQIWVPDILAVLLTNYATLNQ
jgi:hypothetical protein